MLSIGVECQSVLHRTAVSDGSRQWADRWWHTTRRKRTLTTPGSKWFRSLPTSYQSHIGHDDGITTCAVRHAVLSSWTTDHRGGWLTKLSTFRRIKQNRWNSWSMLQYNLLWMPRFSHSVKLWCANLLNNSENHIICDHYIKISLLNRIE